MTQRFSFASLILWLFVIFLGIENGAGLYETLVVTPLWASAPPESVLEYYRHNTSDPNLMMNAGPRFWMFFTPMTGLLALLTLLTGFRTRPEHRKWRIASSGLALFLIVVTLAWFAPTIIQLTSEGVLELSREQIASNTNWWVTLNWGRVVAGLSAWIGTLYTLTTPSAHGEV